ncbi:heme-degrading domain-containing protein [Martelella mediterranea]|uniref:heme-degrading domain-containing protein n=1 Tax=Martelella mediterranea TaxID=293089 RepID=UPI001E3A28C8|nr:heme-degrading domain-containing protein [Martelella mediterranea]MCD1632802.1 heme-degrading domain-containing protein [Martelella mediterranea]|tara:strand:- start:781 stop:1251 length:471 start_codon:yes stop_codon:yes gene_type:complete
MANELEDQVAGQEKKLVLARFDETDAWDLGQRLVDRALALDAPVVIDIRTPSRTLFHAALPGSAPDNDMWARRKSNVVFHFHRSSYAIELEHRRKGRTIGPELGLNLTDYADHGGSFPVRIRHVGVVAAITVSGLASKDDHGLIVDVLTAFVKEQG